MVENGLPNLESIKIFHAGIRSRIAATDLTDKFQFSGSKMTIFETKQNLIENIDHYKNHASDITKEWLDILSTVAKSKLKTITKFPKIKLTDFKADPATKLFIHRFGSKTVLADRDLTSEFRISKSNVDFSQLWGIPGLYFGYDDENEYWILKTENPYITLT